MSRAEVTKFHDTLDVSGDGFVSWGELVVDYFGTGYAFEYYVSRWRASRYSGVFLDGLNRREGINYDLYRKVYQYWLTPQNDYIPS